LVKTHAGVSRFNARLGAQKVADQAKSIGMYASDSLQLMISAAEPWMKSGWNKNDWWGSLNKGFIYNQANGTILDWMPSQFTKHELVWFGRAGIRLIGQDPDAWGKAEEP
jgi:hypothetical protein